MGLPRRHRLSGRSAFTGTVRGGRRAGGRFLVVHLSPGASGSPEIPEPVTPPATEPAGSAQPRVGFIVSRAVGGSVVRHAVTRRLRELVRPRLAALGSGATLVVRALPTAATATSGQLASDLDRCLSRVGVAR